MCKSFDDRNSELDGNGVMLLHRICYKCTWCGWVVESVTSLLRGCLYTSAGKIRSKRIVGRDCV